MRRAITAGGPRSPPPERRRTATRPETWRAAFLEAPYLRDSLLALGVLSDTFETAITWDRFGEFHSRVERGGPPRGRRGHRRSRRRRGRAAGDVPLHPRLPGRPGSLLHGAGAGAARVRGRAVGRDQGRGVGGDHLGRRDDHPPSRGRPRSPALVRPAAPRPVRRGAGGREAAVDPAAILNPGVLDRPDDPCRFRAERDRR